MAADTHHVSNRFVQYFLVTGLDVNIGLEPGKFQACFQIEIRRKDGFKINCIISPKGISSLENYLFEHRSINYGTDVQFFLSDEGNASLEFASEDAPPLDKSYKPSVVRLVTLVYGNMETQQPRFQYFFCNLCNNTKEVSKE